MFTSLDISLVRERNGLLLREAEERRLRPSGSCPGRLRRAARAFSPGRTDGKKVRLQNG